MGVEGRRVKVVAKVKAASRAMWDVGPQRGLGGCLCMGNSRGLSGGGEGRGLWTEI